MNTVELIEAMNYPVEVPEATTPEHQIAVEIITRLQQLDEVAPGDEYTQPAGLRLVNRLAAVARKDRRAYRLLLDMIGDQRSFTDSLDTLASRHQNSSGHRTTRQAWLQNAQADVETVKVIWPQVGEVMGELLRRRLKE